VAIRKAKEDIREEVNQVRSDMSSYISTTDLALKAENDFIKFEIAGTFSLLACLISAYNVWCHLRHFAKPSIQRRILAILIMVPVYSLTSWLSLILASAEPFLSAVRDCYEAYIVYTFMAMLVEILGNSNGPNAAVLVLESQIREDRRALQELDDLLDREERDDEQHTGRVEELMRDEQGLQMTSSSPVPPPLLARVQSASHDLLTEASASTSASLHDVRPPCPCSYDEKNPKSIAAAILYQCQILAMQFVFLKPVLAAFPFFLELSGVPYTDHSLLTEKNSLDWTSPKLYVYTVLNISVSLAFYGLMKFYYATSTQLAWCDPWPKFLTIKVIVFMTFWQGIAITGMSIMGLVDEASGMAAQNILICIEMLLASLMHHLFFPYREWQEGYKKEKDEGLSHLRDTLVLRDFVTDVKGMLSQQVWEDVPPPPASERGLAVAGTALAAKLNTQRRNIGAALQDTVSWLTPGSTSGAGEFDENMVDNVNERRSVTIGPCSPISGGGGNSVQRMGCWDRKGQNMEQREEPCLEGNATESTSLIKADTITRDQNDIDTYDDFNDKL